MFLHLKVGRYELLRTKHMMLGKARGPANANRNNVIYEACGSAFLEHRTTWESFITVSNRLVGFI
jgi:hypothetical protein